MAICLFTLVACATNPSHNIPLTLKSQGEYDFRNWIVESGKFNNGIEHKDTLIALSFSGGGLRAAALAAAVVEKLKELKLYDRVAIISSTSGGSVTAGFVAAKGVEKFPELKEKFFLWDNTMELKGGVISSLLTGANRSQKFADYLDTRLFYGSDKPITYDDLRVRWREAPFVILNATDASYGHTFEFKQATFSTLCSDLGSFRISEAIAASAAFPFLMSPVTLRNNWDKCEFKCRKDKNLFDRVSYELAVELKHFNLENFVRWRHTHSLRYTYEQDEKNNPYRQVKFVHLLDGGLSDNLAARALLRTFGENNSENIRKLKEMGVRRILLIQVNAKSESPNDIDMSGKIPSLFSVIKSAALNPIDVTTTLSSYISREYMVSLVRYLNGDACSKSDQEIYIYPVQVDFDLLESGSRDQINAKAIPTWWTLPSSDIDLLERVGKNLLVEHPCFQAFAQDSHIKDTPVDSANNCRDYIKLRVADARLGTSPPPPVPAPPPPPEKVCITLNVEFDFDKYDIKPKYHDVIGKVAEFMKEYPETTAVIEGHTDNRGSYQYNIDLSERRANSVRNYLIQKFNIEPTRLSTKGYGYTKPIAANMTAEGRQKNRRIEAMIDCVLDIN